MLTSAANETKVFQPFPKPFKLVPQYWHQTESDWTCNTYRRLLHAFQNQVNAQIGESDPALAADLTAAAQKIIDAGCAE